MTNFNERTNTLLYKNISLTLYSRKGWCWLCVRSELETWTDCYILTESSSTRAALLPHLGWGFSTVGHWGPQALSLQADSHAGILFPTDSNSNCNSNWPKPSVAPGYIIVWRPPASVFECHKRFKEGRESVRDNERCGRSKGSQYTRVDWP